MNAVPTESGSCTTLLAAVIKATVSSNVLFAAFIDEADRVKPSKIPEVSIGSVFAQNCYSFYLSNKKE